MLIDHGADLNACTVLDETPLHFAGTLLLEATTLSILNLTSA